jgi:hypothetical protein
MNIQPATHKEPLISVKSGIYTAVVGALGAILTLFAIPLAPNVALNLYVFPGILVGGTSGVLLGALAGFIGSLYTPILWGWFGAIPYNTFLGAATGFFSKYLGLRPTIGVFLGHIIYLPVLYWTNVLILGLPSEIFWTVGMFSTAAQILVSAVIAEILMNIPAIKKRLPKTDLHAPGWVARSKLLRHPWLKTT